MMAMDHVDEPIEWFAAWYRLDGEDRYLLWWQDGVYAEADRRISSFQSVADIQAFAAEKGITVDAEEPILHDLDIIAGWSMQPERSTIVPDPFLGAWNLFDNVAATTRELFPPEEVSWVDVYHMLFWGCNLPAMTPPGEHYAPAWDDNDVATIATVLTSGLRLFRDAVIHHELGV